MKSLCYSTLLFCTFTLHAQEYPRTAIDLNHIADELYSVPDLDLNYEEIYENLVQLLSHPVNLNKATIEDLRFLKGLTETQIQELMHYRAKNGNFLSVYELQAVPGFDLQTIYNFIPFVTVTDPLTSIDTSFWRRIYNEGEHYFLLRYERTLESKKGFLSGTDVEDRFKGSPDKVYLRFRSSKPGDFSFGFTAEKDQGEAIIWNPPSKQYGFDYISFHAQIQNKGRLKNLVLGDYQSQFGQGLLFGGGFGMGKGGETITTTRRSNIGLLPYTSVNEAEYLSGIGTTIEVNKNIYFTGLYSNTKRDATLTNGQEEETIISSFQTTGLHRNRNELAKRKKIGEQNIGGVLQYKNNSADLGLTFHQINFDAAVEKKSTPYNQYAFSGKHNLNAGIYFNYTIQNLAFFSEAAHSLKNGNAWIAGILWSLTSKCDLSILHRKFDKDFYTFYSSAFAENSIPQNESGTYWGWKYRFNRKFSTMGYADLFRFPWLKYRSYSPSHGHEWMLRVNYQPSRKTTIFAQVREESKTRNITDNNANTYHTGQAEKRNYWISFDHGINQKLRMKTRIQCSTFEFNHNTTKGFAIMQDISMEAGKFQCTARYALFDTDDYDNRQYAYENDVWLAYSLPAYYGVGIRKYVLIEYKLNKQLTFWLRYAHTRYTDREEIGSGIDSIDGNTRNDVKFEMRIRF